MKQKNEIESKLELLRDSLIDAINNFGKCDITINLICEDSLEKVNIINIEKGMFTYVSNIFGVKQEDEDDLSLLTINELYEIYLALNE